MNIRRESPGEEGAGTGLTSSQEMRDLAEALSLYRSAMRHVAEKQAVRPVAPATQRSSGLRMRLVLVPALGAALAAAVIGPAYMHLHHASAAPGNGAPAAQVQTAGNTTTVAKVDDAQLMNQIDSDLTESVPDALQPLTGWDDTSTTATTTTGTEK
jgi:hypothetical protein